MEARHNDGSLDCNDYLKEPGDFDLLNVQVPFLSSKTLQPDPDCTGSVYDHAKIALQSLFSDVGYHGLCRIGYGDWNDALSGLGGGDAVWASRPTPCSTNAQSSRMRGDVHVQFWESVGAKFLHTTRLPLNQLEGIFIYSLVASCKLNEIDPFAYFRDILNLINYYRTMPK